MGFEPGSFLGPYQVLERIGAGGMGEVYRARDPRLSRDVAVKVLPESAAVDPLRLHRFQQEARAAGALSHPNVMVVFDVGSHDGMPYLVFELLEGATLKEQLALGSLPPRKAVDYAMQIAEGLAAAHDKGIIHRDLKPGNLFVTRTGRLKILDFGLAKLQEPLDTTAAASGEGNAEMSTGTGMGMGMGTAGYMSPEQLQGLPVDHRADIFALGTVLYEILSGRRAFPGRSAQEIRAAILRSDPSSLVGVRDIPPALARLVQRCLEKSPTERFQSAHDVGLALRLLSESEAHRPRRWQRRWVAAAGLVGVVALGLTAVRGRLGYVPGVSVSPPKVVPFTSFSGLEFQPAISPDGQYVAFSWDGENGDSLNIYDRRVGSEAITRLTSDAGDAYSPAWSPDGSWIAFIRVNGTDAAVFVVSSAGGPERRLRALRPWFGSSLDWSPDGRYLLFTDSDSSEGPFGAFLLSPDDLTVKRLTNPSPRYLGDAFPAFSPGGETVAFARLSPWGGLLLGAELSLVPTGGGSPHVITKEPLLIGGLDWTADGREIVFSSSRSGAAGLWRIPVSGGQPRPLWGEEGPVLWNATPAESIMEISRAFRVSISRTANRLVYTRGFYDTDIWQVGAPGAAGISRTPTKLIATTQLEEAPQFSPDGRMLAFASTRTGPTAQIWVCQADGSGCAQLTSFDVPCGTPRWSPDSHQIVFDAPREGNSDIYAIELSARLIRRITTAPSWECVPSWSGDGRWIYFASDRTGSWQAWKTPAQGGSALQVTFGGGFATFESADGRTVYYTKSSSPGIWKIPAEGGSEHLVLDRPNCWGAWAVSSEGIYVIDTQTKRAATVEFFPHGAGPPVDVAVLSGRPPCGESSLAVSPDGRKIAYVDAVRGSDVMMVENFR